MPAGTLELRMRIILHSLKTTCFLDVHLGEKNKVRCQYLALKLHFGCTPTRDEPYICVCFEVC